MILSKKLKKCLLGLMVVLVIGGMTGFAPADELLDMMPDNSLVCIRVNHFNPTLMQVDQFLAGASPVGISMFARMGLGRVFGNPMMPGVDQNGSFGAFIYKQAPEAGANAAMPPVGAALLVPVTDYKAFLEGNPNCSEADAQGVSTLEFQQMPGVTMAQVGGYALLGVNTPKEQLIHLRDSLNAKRTPLTTSLKADQQKVATDAPIWVFINMKSVNGTFGPMIQAQLQMISQVMAQQAQAAPQAMPMNPAKIISVYGDIINRLLTESQSLTVTVTPKPEALSIRKTLVAVPDSNLAKAFAGDTSKTPNPLLGHLKDGAFMNIAFNPSHIGLKPLNEWSLNLVAEMFGQNITPEQKEKIKQLAADSLDALGQAGVYAATVDSGAKPPFAVDYIFAIKDEAKFRRVMDEGMNLYNTLLAPMYKQMGLISALEMRKNADTHQGVVINEIQFKFDVTDANAPETQMIKAMYGEGMTIQWAIVNNTYVASMGSDKVAGLIDRVKAGVPASKATEIENALQLAPDGAASDVFVTFNLIRVLNLVKAFAPVPLPLPAMDFPTSSNIVAAASIGNGQLSGDLIIPKQHVMEIMQVVQALMAQKAQQQQSNTGTPNVDN